MHNEQFIEKSGQKLKIQIGIILQKIYGLISTDKYSRWII